MNGIKAVSWLAGALTVALLLGGCTSSLSGRAYDRSHVQQPQAVQMGTVVHVRDVRIEGTKSGIGTAAGGVAGGIAGSSIGHGRGSALGALGGAIVGGLLGSAVEEGSTQRPGVEITVQLDSGRTVAIVQEADEAFYPGDRVRVLTAYDGTTRVTH